MTTGTQSRTHRQAHRLRGIRRGGGERFPRRPLSLARLPCGVVSYERHQGTPSSTRRQKRWPELLAEPSGTGTARQRRTHQTQLLGNPLTFPKFRFTTMHAGDRRTSPTRRGGGKSADAPADAGRRRQQRSGRGRRVRREPSAEQRRPPIRSPCLPSVPSLIAPSSKLSAATGHSGRTADHPPGEGWPKLAGAVRGLLRPDERGQEVNRGFQKVNPAERCLLPRQVPRFSPFLLRP